VNLLMGSLTQGLITALLALGVFITFRVFESLDLTAEGSYGLAAAVTAVMLVKGVHPIPATALGALGGAAAGVVTGLLHTKLRVPLLLAGIVTTTAIYSIILIVMHGGDQSLAPFRSLTKLADELAQRMTGGRGDITLFGTTVIASLWMGLILTFVVVAGCVVALNAFFHTNLGLAMRATGDNPLMARALGADVGRMQVLGLALSNALIGLSGAIFGQFLGAVNISMGLGILVTGLASLMIGETVVGRKGVGRWIIAAVAGSVLYRLLVAAVIRAGLNANALKLVTALLVLAALVFPQFLRRRARKGIAEVLVSGG
jgi:putative ABC transport system permease protein